MAFSDITFSMNNTSDKTDGIITLDYNIKILSLNLIRCIKLYD